MVIEFIELNLQYNVDLNKCITAATFLLSQMLWCWYQPVNSGGLQMDGTDTEVKHAGNTHDCQNNHKNYIKLSLLALSDTD